MGKVRCFRHEDTKMHFLVVHLVIIVTIANAATGRISSVRRVDSVSCELQLFNFNEVDSITPLFQLPKDTITTINVERITRFRIVSNGESECCWAVKKKRQRRYRVRRRLQVRQGQY